MSLTNQFKKTLREEFGFTNIKQTYSVFGVNNPEAAYKKLLKEYNKITKEDVSAKAQEWLSTKMKEAKEKIEKKQKKQVIDNKKYIQNWTLTFKKQYKAFNKKAGKWYEESREQITIGTKKQLNKKIKLQFEMIVDKIRQASPYESKDFKITIGELTEIKKSNGLENIKMKHANVFELSNECNQSWNTNNGTCVFDYLIHLYGNTKGFKKIMNYNYLNNEFSNEDENCLIEGVSINKIDNFCKKYSLSYYALDSYEKTIKFYIPEIKKHNVNALIFRLINGHMYPIEDYQKRQSIVNKHRKDCNIKSAEIETSKQKEKKIYNLITPDKECDKNKFAINFIDELNKIPYPIIPKNIYVEDGNIQRLIIDNKLILTEPINQDVKDFYEKSDRVYQGESIQSILYELWEETYDEKIYEGKLMSSFNPKIDNILNQTNIKNRTHYGSTRIITEDMKDLFLNEGAISCDIEKCYSSLLLNPFDDFMVLNSYNEIEKFTNEDYYYDDSDLPFGLYIVKTNDLTILHQSNIYSNKILDYAKKNNVEFKIIYQILATEQIEPNYFHSLLNNITDKTDNINLIKLLINTITGCLGKTYNKKLKVGLTTNLDEIWENDILKNCDNKNNEYYFKKFNINEKDLFISGEIEKTKMINNALPIYIQILDWSNIKLSEMIKKMGGECIYRKTDCAVCIGGNYVKEIEKDINNITKTWGSFRNEDCSDDKILTRDFTRLMNKDRHIEINEINNDWINANFYSSNQWEDILKYAIENKGLFIDGRAGTGKSYIIHKGIENKYLNEDKKYRLAFTNKAARNINGTTIHKALAINNNNKSNIKSMTLKYQGETIICIDEIGMIPLHIWKKILLLKQANKDLIFILLGDKRQTTPIEDYNIDYFNSSIVKCLVNYNKCELTERQRYNEELWNFLEDYFEKGIVGKLKHKKDFTIDDIKKSRMICYFNKTRESINNKCMEIMKPNNALYLPYEKINDDDKSSSAYIYKDIPIMCIKNNKKYDIINSDEFIVSSYDDKTITLINNDNNKEIIIEHNEFHKNFVVNYISTTHKLQGATITNNLLIFDWYPKHNMEYCLKDDKHIGYTALSRVKTLDQIYICGTPAYPN